MRHELQREADAEARMLGVIALVCYAAAFAAMLAFGYSMLVLAIRAAGRDIAALFTSAGI
jgi:hypothetical protein